MALKLYVSLPHGLPAQPGSAALTLTGFAPTIVVASAGGPDAVFRTIWDAATGVSPTARTDGGKWTSDNDTGHTILNVVPAASVGIADAPTTNVLQVKHTKTAPVSGTVGVGGLWTSPQIGESRYWRVYLRVEIADAEGDYNSFNNHHPLEAGNASGFSTENFEMIYGTKNNSTYPWKFALINVATAQAKWIPSSAHNVQAFLPKFVFLRYEWKLTKVSVDHYTLDMRIYNASDVLIYDSSTIRDSAVDLTMAASGANIPFPAGTDAQLNTIQIGENGGPFAFANDQYSYWAAFCVRSDDWCGPYSLARG